MNCAAAGSAAVVDTAEGSANHGYVSEIIYPRIPREAMCGWMDGPRFSPRY